MAEPTEKKAEEKTPVKEKKGGVNFSNAYPAEVQEIVGRTGIVSDVQLFKYKAKLLLRHRLVV